MSIIDRIMGNAKEGKELMRKREDIDCVLEMKKWCSNQIEAALLLKKLDRLLSASNVDFDPGAHSSVEFDTPIDGIGRIKVVFDTKSKSPISAEIVEDAE